jgi:hypothetical protein
MTADAFWLLSALRLPGCEKRIHDSLMAGTPDMSADDGPAIAKRLTMEIYRMLRGEMVPVVIVSGSGRALDYPKSGTA